MTDDKLTRLLNNLDDDLAEKEIDKLLEGIEIDLEAINEKAHHKLFENKNKLRFIKRVLPYTAAACLCLIGITGVYANDISDVVKSFFNKTAVYSTIVDGDAYYLKESHAINNQIVLESVMVSEGKLEMEMSTGLSERELGNIKIIPQDNSQAIYSPGGYSQEGKQYFFSFMNEKEGNYHITPFREFKLSIAGNTYNVLLEKAQKIDLNGKIQTAQTSADKLTGVNIGAKVLRENEKLNVQLIAAFENMGVKLEKFGEPTETKVIYVMENKGKDGVFSYGTGSKTDDLYVFDEMNNRCKLEIPQKAKAYPVTVFETTAPKDKKLTLKLPALIASYNKPIEALVFNIPHAGTVTLNKEIDFGLQKAIIKNIKRISPTSAQVEFELNTAENKNIELRSCNFYSPEIKKISAEFNGDKAVMTLESDKQLNTADIQAANPSFVINGNWQIELK